MASKACFEVSQTMTEEILAGSTREEIHEAMADHPVNVCQLRRTTVPRPCRPSPTQREGSGQGPGHARFAKRQGIGDATVEWTRSAVMHGDQDDPWEGGGWGEEALARRPKRRKRQPRRKKGARRRKERRTEKRGSGRRRHGSEFNKSCLCCERGGRGRDLHCMGHLSVVVAGIEVLETVHCICHIIPIWYHI